MAGEARIGSLRARLDELRKLDNILRNDPQKVLRNGAVSVYIGDGYFVDLDIKAARSFVERRTTAIHNELDYHCQIQGLSEDGLPIMEIFEELDEEGNVINSRVEKTGNALEQISRSLRDLEDKSIKTEGSTSVVAPTSEEPKAIQNLPSSSSPSSSSVPARDQVTSVHGNVRSILIKDSRDHDPSDDVKIEEIESVDGTPDDAQTETLTDASSTAAVAAPREANRPTYHGISREDMLELELLNEQIENMEVAEDEDELEQMDMDDLDGDFDDNFDDDSEDEDEYGRTRGSLFPQTAAVQELLKKTVATQAPEVHKSIVSDSTIARPKPQRKRSVHFGDSPEIVEFETTANERRDPDFGGEPLYGDDPNEEKKARKVSFGDSVEICEFVTSSDERRSPLYGGTPVYDPDAEGSEENGLPEEPESEPTAPKQKRVSRFKQQREVLHPENTVSARQVEEVAPSTGAIVKDTVVEREPVAPRVTASTTRNKGPAYSRSNKQIRKPDAVPLAAPTVQTREPPAEFQGIGDVRPEDSISETIARNRDLEQDALKYFDDSTISDDAFMSLHNGTFDENEDIELPANPRRQRPDQPLMTEIVEKSPVSGDEDMSFDENDVDMKDIRNEYHRLRQKLVQKSGGYRKTDVDQETEALDENGDPVKVSRFRSARMGLR